MQKLITQKQNICASENDLYNIIIFIINVKWINFYKNENKMTIAYNFDVCIFQNAQQIIDQANIIKEKDKEIQTKDAK